MELNTLFSKSEIVLASIQNIGKLVFNKNCENWVKKQIQSVIFSKSFYNCLQNKKLHNFHITNPNGMKSKLFI